MMHATDYDKIKLHVDEIKAACHKSGLVVILGSAASGRTHLLRLLKDVLEQAGQTAVCRSLAVEKEKV